ncbi:MAG TPA: hypothetical protein VNW92_14165, partial [Polyangiaceae bacterium]|nr:hypothetical protein [Polyangiaceae bacterium]
APAEPDAVPAAAPKPADEAPAAPVASAEPAPPPEVEAPAKPKPPPYSLPWQLRPVAPGNVVRLDSSYGFYKNPTTDKNGSALVTSLLGSYKIIPDLALIARVGLVSSAPPSAPQPAPQSATAILNPVLAGLYGVKLSPDFKLGLFLGVTLPVGTGGGNNPDKDKVAAISPLVGMATRSAMDNAMFAVNYFTVFPGVDFAYVHGGLTVQAEATIFKLTKARGPDTSCSPGCGAPIDHTNTNFTSGLHVGYFIIPMLSLGAEIRHQRWLSTPNAVAKDYLAAGTHSTRDTTTFAIGPRLHFKLSDSIWFRPGVSLSLPIDDPMKKYEYKVVQLDLPLSF